MPIIDCNKIGLDYYAKYFENFKRIFYGIDTGYSLLKQMMIYAIFEANLVKIQ